MWEKTAGLPAVAGGHLDEPVEGAAVFNPRITALLVQGHIQLGKVTNRIIFVSVSVSITVIPVVFWVTVVSVVVVVVEFDIPTGGLVDGGEVVVLHVPLVPHHAHQLQLPSLAEAGKEQEEERAEKFCVPHCRAEPEASATPQVSPLLLSTYIGFRRNCSGVTRISIVLIAALNLSSTSFSCHTLELMTF